MDSKESDFGELDRLRLENKELDAKLRALVDESPGGVYIIQEGRFVYVNPRLAEITGCTQEEVVGTDASEWVHPEDRKTVREIHEEKISGELPRSRQEFRIIKKDGSVAWLEVHSIRTTYLGRPAVIGTALDITKRKRAEEALRGSEEHYRTLFDAIDEGFCIVEVIFDERNKPVDYRFLEVNPSFEKQTGLIDARGKKMRDLAPKHEEYWFEIYGNIALTGQPARFQNRAEQLNRWYDVFAFRFGQPENRQVAILFNDITKRKRAEEALRESEERLRFALETSHIGAWDLNLIDHTAFSSPENDRIFGYSEPLPKWTYEMFLEHVLPEDRAEVDGKFKHAMATGSGWNFECRIRRADGEVRWIWAAGRQRPGPTGELRMMSGITQDITERKEIEHARHDFVSMLTHDLKSPLTTILGYADLLAGIYGKTENGEMIASIQRSAMKMMRMVEDFLTVSRLETGKMQLTLMQESVPQLLDRVARDFIPAAEKKGVRLETDIGEIPPACVDLKYMERSVGNLLQNAISYTPPGGRVVLKAESGSRGNGRRHEPYLAISVADTGPGVPEEDKARIFDKYFSAPKTKGIKGTGLGLAIVKAIAEAHGGRAAVESEPGKGSAFHMYMPLRTAC